MTKKTVLAPVFGEEPRAEEPKFGANDRDRTDDLLITNELLYQLSYIGQKSAY